ncbi:2-amino-4-hydroxy-6-hydroxymethyldihydropteridine diphosphokinase [Qipengyuania sp. RANM35]|uniref:2-amino-4-hydroxy-6- hydroxymethyldihydropteridine diphosphokinase n=1 Tax=Qipengyuania sp. RANM35 TaxID=3068635 RepID=UPI0034DACCA7
MVEASEHCYLIGIGSNMRVPGIGNPRAVIIRAVDALAELGMDVVAVSRVIETRPVGPASRSYANAAAIVLTQLDPPEVLHLFKEIEAAFGRRHRGLPWRARPLDLDLVLWSGGIWVSPELAIPHPHFRTRPFVIRPAAEVAPGWKDPVTGLTLRQLAFRGV